jgi:hypothetical protein
MTENRKLFERRNYVVVPVVNGFLLTPLDVKDDQLDIHMKASETFVFSCRLDLADFLKTNLEPKG